MLTGLLGEGGERRHLGFGGPGSLLGSFSLGGPLEPLVDVAAGVLVGVGDEVVVDQVAQPIGGKLPRVDAAACAPAVEPGPLRCRAAD